MFVHRFLQLTVVRLVNPLYSPSEFLQRKSLEVKFGNFFHENMPKAQKKREATPSSESDSDSGPDDVSSFFYWIILPICEFFFAKSYNFFCDIDSVPQQNGQRKTAARLAKKMPMETLTLPWTNTSASPSANSKAKSTWTFVNSTKTKPMANWSQAKRFELCQLLFVEINSLKKVFFDFLSLLSI